MRLACISLVIAFGLTACSDDTGIVAQADRSELALKAEITSVQAPTPERTAVNLDSRGRALHGHGPVAYRENRTAFSRLLKNTSRITVDSARVVLSSRRSSMAIANTAYALAWTTTFPNPLLPPTLSE